VPWKHVEKVLKLMHVTTSPSSSLLFPAPCMEDIKTLGGKPPLMLILNVFLFEQDF
jgi:hypothetical protein